MAAGAPTGVHKQRFGNPCNIPVYERQVCFKVWVNMDLSVLSVVPRLTFRRVWVWVYLFFYNWRTEVCVWKATSHTLCRWPPVRPPKDTSSCYWFIGSVAWADIWVFVRIRWISSLPLIFLSTAFITSAQHNAVMDFPPVVFTSVTTAPCDLQHVHWLVYCLFTFIHSYTWLWSTRW